MFPISVSLPVIPKTLLLLCTLLLFLCYYFFFFFLHEIQSTSISYFLVFTNIFPKKMMLSPPSAGNGYSTDSSFSLQALSICLNIWL